MLTLTLARFTRLCSLSPTPRRSPTSQRHTLTVQPRKKLTSHVDFDVALESLTKHFNKGLSFSTTPLEVSPPPRASTSFLNRGD